MSETFFSMVQLGVHGSTTICQELEITQHGIKRFHQYSKFDEYSFIPYSRIISVEAEQRTHHSEYKFMGQTKKDFFECSLFLVDDKTENFFFYTEEELRNFMKKIC